MTSSELREKFLEFFEKRGHKIALSSSLIPSDPSVLFTTAGMQQFKPYYLGEKSPYGLNVASCQKCFRTSDIDNVGNERHLTFLEMLGNFSFGDYEKKEAIKLAKEFLDSINIKIDYVTVFGGDETMPRDEESVKVWEKLGFSEKSGTLRFCEREDNFWGPTGDEGPCGPTTEIYSQGLEIWNIVFNQYYCDKEKKLKGLPIFSVDTGMGLERLAKVSQDVPTIFETDLFSPLIEEIDKTITLKNIQVSQKSSRIIADHIKGAVFLISEGILPSNVERGYVLRRILRRAIRYGKLLDQVKQFLIPLAQRVVEIYQDVYPELKTRETDILTVIKNEEEKFEKTLEQGLKEFNDFVLRREPRDGKVGVVWDQMIFYGKEAFYLYQSFGFPKEIMQELCAEKNIKFDEEGFEGEMRKHQEISRAGAESKFGGGGEFSPKLHTATHLLHAALRQVLGKNVQQMGSDITAERLRFDFSHSPKMTKEEIKKTEDLVNEKIKDGLDVKKEEMLYEEAIKSGALAFFKEKYPERVNVYSVRDFSREICAGPHVKKTSEIGGIKIIKEESSGAGVRRLRAILEK